MPLLPCRPSTCSIGKTKSPATRAGCVRSLRTPSSFCSVLRRLLAGRTSAYKRCERRAPTMYLYSLCEFASNKWSRLIALWLPSLSERASECLSLNGSINKAKADRCSLSKCFLYIERMENEWTQEANRLMWMVFLVWGNQIFINPLVFSAAEIQAKNSTKQISSLAVGFLLSRTSSTA